MACIQGLKDGNKVSLEERRCFLPFYTTIQPDKKTKKRKKTSLFFIRGNKEKSELFLIEATMLPSSLYTLPVQEGTPNPL